MYNSIRSKILSIVGLTFFVLILVLVVFSFAYYQKSKQILLKSYSNSIGFFAQNINKEVIGIEDSARDLASFGEVYYRTQRKTLVLEKFVSKVFENYQESIGGGIWYKPYTIDKSKKRNCAYAYRNKNNIIIIDKNFESEEYNYLTQNWYKEITSKITKEKNIAWSLPYKENQGSEAFMITAGSGIYVDGQLIGISTVDWEISSILKSILKIKPTPNSFALFADLKNDYILISTDKYLDNDNLVGKSLKNIPWYDDNLITKTYFTYHNTKYIPYVKYLDNDMVLIVNIPKWEMFRSIIKNLTVMFMTLISFCLFLWLILYMALKKNIINPILKLTDMAKKIGSGDLSLHLKIEKPLEFAQLADTFDKMTSDIKTITKKQVRLDSELAIAKSIQSSSLPQVFPPYPDRSEFDIYASMIPAKEVGGDFYDFYFTGPDTFLFLIADVSGKGVPAALFMMKVKTLIANMAQTSCQPKDLIEAINKEICHNNKEGFFVTLFACIVNIYSGETFCINCGHNPPLIKHNNNYEFLKTVPNIVLGAFQNAEFDIYNTKLEQGDRIFLYTDGVTEAMNDKDEMYGEKRLIDSINLYKNEGIKETINNIKSNVDNFVSKAEQSDDMTMVIFQFNGNNKTYKNKAKKDNYKDFYNWLHSVCEEWNLDDELKNKIDMCAEEIFANITFYAYPSTEGNIEVNINKTNNTIIMNFTDEGIPYNPLEKPDPDITLPPEKRTPGGLGIFMVKQMTQKLTYERLDNKNILNLVFNLNIEN